MLPTDFVFNLYPGHDKNYSGGVMTTLVKYPA